MITKEKIDRINALAHKAKTAEGLTDAEKEEQQILRREYIDSFKANLRAQLENIRFHIACTHGFSPRKQY